MYKNLFKVVLNLVMLPLTFLKLKGYFYKSLPQNIGSFVINWQVCLWSIEIVTLPSFEVMTVHACNKKDFMLHYKHN
jgi:hypothetical protein